MRLRSFHGDTLASAMNQVREALGDEAIIVATRDDENGGVRVTAAMDDTGAIKKAALTPAETAKATAAMLAAENYNEDVIEVLADQLTRHHVSPALAEKILTTATHFAEHDVLIALAAAMDKHFKFAPLVDGASIKPICLVGPPGAGKTLTIAKLAASRVLAKKTVGVITTDLTRAGAVEQLSAYTKLLKLHLIEVEDAYALRDAVDAHKRNEWVLVDSSGRNPYHKSDMLELKKMVMAADVEPVLVIPAGMDALEAADMAQAFMEIGARKLILTKLDMTRRMGSLVNLAHETGLHLCEMSLSPKVTDALQVLNPVTFAQLLLPRDAVQAALKSNSTSGDGTGTIMQAEAMTRNV